MQVFANRPPLNATSRQLLIGVSRTGSGVGVVAADLDIVLGCFPRLGNLSHPLKISAPSLFPQRRQLESHCESPNSTASRDIEAGCYERGDA
jgi:hypothetical protein